MTRSVPGLAAGLSFLAYAALLTGCGSFGEDAGDSAATASLTVEAVLPHRMTWPRQLACNGGLKAWQEAIVSAETGPLRIASLRADVGSRVRRGAVLATLARDTVLADQARLRAQLAEAEASRAKASSDVARAWRVEESGALSAQQIQQYRVTQQTATAVVAGVRAQLRSNSIQLGQTNIVAVDDGVVSSRSALLGKVVNVGEELFRIVRQDRIEWQCELDARQLAQVRPGQTGRVTLPGGQSVNGPVRLVSPTLNGDTSRGIAYVQLPAGSPARAGMYGSGVIEVAVADVMTVPDTALVLHDGRSYVHLVRDDNRVHRQEVVAGQRRDGRVAVAGVPANASIVRSGGSFLSDGAIVRVARTEARR